MQWGGTPANLAPPATFAIWLDGHFNSTELLDPLITGPIADPDGDGLMNLIEFAVGTVPNDPGSGNVSALPTYTVTPGPDTLDHLNASFTVST